MNCKHPHMRCEHQSGSGGDKPIHCLIPCRAATSCLYDAKPKPSPLTIEIKEELFDKVERYNTLLRFFFHIHTQEFVVSCHTNGEWSSDGVIISTKQRKEIERVIEALGWNGETK